jgi:hypothetical protein
MLVDNSKCMRVGISFLNIIKIAIIEEIHIAVFVTFEPAAIALFIYHNLNFVKQ